MQRELLNKKPKLQKQFIQAWDMTLKHVHEHPDDSYTTLTERLPISIKEFKQSMNLIQIATASEQQHYFNKDGLLNNNLIKMGNTVFMHFDNEEIDYSQFLYNSTSK